MLDGNHDSPPLGDDAWQAGCVRDLPARVSAPVNGQELQVFADPDSEIQLSGTWSIGDSLTAGYLQSIAAKAALSITSHPHPVVVSTEFLIPAQPGSALVNAQTLRRGKTVDTVRVTLYQQDQAVCSSTVTASTLEPGPPDVDHCEQIQLPTPERCTRLESDSMRGRHLGVLDNVELRLAPECVTVLRGGADGSFTLRGWLRMADGSEPDPLLCFALVDAFPPVTYTIGRYGWAPSIHMSSYLRDIPAQGWLRAEKRGRLLSGGWIDDLCTMRDSSGAVVAQAHQLVRLPRAEKKPRY